jgi:hypothetical protein
MSVAIAVKKGKRNSGRVACSTSLEVLAGRLDDFVREAADEGCSLDDVERSVLDRVLTMGEAAINLFLELQGDGDLGERVTTEDGVTLSRSDQPVEKPLQTVFGRHTVRQFVYSRGPKRKIELRPLEARLNLPEGVASYLFEEFSQFFCVEQAFGTARRSLHAVLRQDVCVDTLERINQRMGSQADEYLEQLPVPPGEEEGQVLVFTGDGKGVPLVKPDTARLPVCSESPDRPGNRRMATLACVYSVDRHVRCADEVVAALFRDDVRPASHERPQPRFKHTLARFGQTYEDGEETIEVPSAFEAFSWAAGQVAQRRQPNQPLIRLMDGQESLWNAADACLECESDADILDIIHVAGYIRRAAKVFHQHEEYREAFSRDRLLRILRGETAQVIAGLRQMATKRKLTGEARKEINTVCGYFQNNLHRMRYDEYLQAGYPIASGVIEGACRHLVKDRMERTGMRWCLKNAASMLNVRAVFQSSYWDEFHKTRIQAEQQRLHPLRSLLKGYKPLTA